MEKGPVVAIRIGPTATAMKENSWTVKCLVMALSNGPTATSSRDSTKMAKSMALESSLGSMVISSTKFGRTVNKREAVN